MAYSFNNCIVIGKFTVVLRLIRYDLHFVRKKTHEGVIVLHMDGVITCHVFFQYCHGVPGKRHWFIPQTRETVVKMVILSIFKKREWVKNNFDDQDCLRYCIMPRIELV